MSSPAPEIADSSTATTGPLTRKRTLPTSNKVDIDRLCKMLGVDTLSKREDWLFDEGAENAQHLSDYRDAVLSTAEELFDRHGLQLVPILRRTRSKKVMSKNPDPWQFRVMPSPGRTWGSAALQIMRTINGVGMFGFSNLREFLDSGPYTRREAVLKHLGWIPSWYEVYEGSKASSRVDKRMRTR